MYLHPRTLICVVLISLYVGEIVLLLPVGRALITIMVDVTATGKTIQKVEMLFDCVGECLILVHIVSSRVGVATSTASTSIVVGIGVSTLAAAIVSAVSALVVSAMLLSLCLGRTVDVCWLGSSRHGVVFCVGGIVGATLWKSWGSR